MGSMDGAAYQAGQIGACAWIKCKLQICQSRQVLLQSKLIITALILWAIKGNASRLHV